MTTNQLSVSICVPAYNEEKNIRQILTALLKQKVSQIHINKIVVISSGSTDRTNEIVQEMQKKSSKIMLITEKVRTGKAAAINKFLRIINDDVIVIESADTIPKSEAIEKLCRPFLHDKKIGMTGGAPIPVNDPNTFIGYIIHSWWWFHRNIPRFGEIIACKNILKSIPESSAVDEAFIQADLVKKGFKVIHVDEAQVHNKGPETVGDLIKQRRRIFNGHSRLYQEEKVKIDNMTKSSLKLLLFEFKIKSLKHLIWLIGGVLIEIYSRFLGFYDQYVYKINPNIWDTARTTKDLAIKVEEVV